MADEEETLEGDVLDPGPPPSFPQAGRDLTPSLEKIEKGQHGNGAWDFRTDAVAIAYHERHEAKKEAEDARLDEFNEEAKDKLSEAVRLHGRIIAAGHTIMDAIENGERVNGIQMNILGKALSSSKELTDRAAGKARTSTETTGEVSALAFLVSPGGDS